MELAILHSSPTAFLLLEAPWGTQNASKTITRERLEQDKLLGENKL